MSEWIMILLMLTGGAFLLLAAVGIIRMPDLYSRIQAATKAATLGVGCIILALAIHFVDLGITVRALLVIAFLFLTQPVAAHMIGRAAYFVGVPLWENTIMDELRGRYDASTHSLESPGNWAAGENRAADEERRE
jgi:multicomponent Na+:H+ antiporter subunit G